jgi:hypothetical protein
MLFSHDMARWLEDVDLWTSEQEARDLFEAVRRLGSVGLFHCSASADRSSYFVMTAHHPHASTSLSRHQASQAAELAGILEGRRRAHARDNGGGRHQSDAGDFGRVAARGRFAQLLRQSSLDDADIGLQLG